jgi:hypothetical protein
MSEQNEADTDIAALQGFDCLSDDLPTDVASASLILVGRENVFKAH